MKKEAIFLDLDHALFDTDRFFHVDLRNELVALDVDLALWDDCYPEVSARGYSLYAHALAMQKRAGAAFDFVCVTRMFGTKFLNLRRYLFSDVRDRLGYWKGEGHNLVLLSLGNPTWQWRKLIGAGIAPYFHEIFFTRVKNTKAEVVQRAQERYGRVVVVDNHPEELDAVRDLCGPDVGTVLIDRVPDPVTLASLPPRSFFEARKYRSMVPRHDHFRCTSLNDIILP